MAVRLRFLDWNRPALASAADYLRQTYAADGTFALDQLVVAVPGSRAGRRLLEILVQQAEERSLAFSPPRIVTLGHLPEQLYAVSERFVGPLASQLAWTEALREVGAARLKRVVPELPPADDPSRWLALANLFGQLHAELAGHALRFIDVAECGSELEDFIERDRWLAMAAVQEAYVARLQAAGLADRQWARLEALEGGMCRAENEIVLVGVADPSRVLHRMLEQVADRLTALIHAPASHSARFDELGALQVAAWQEAAIELDDEQIVVVEGPADQAEAALHALASLQSKYSAEDIVIGAPDARIVPYLEQRFEQFELPCRYADGLPAGRSGPFRLLAAAADYLDGGRFADLASLARHPDLEAWLLGTLPRESGEEANWLSELDRYYSEHLQARLTGRWLGGHKAVRGAEALQAAVDRLLGDFDGKRTLAVWAERIARLLVEVYGREPLDRRHASGRIALEACEQLRETLVEAVSLPEGFSADWRAADAIRLFLRQKENDAVPPLPQHAAIEMLGWLELPLDDAPALIVTGFNEGLTPSHVNSDLFLPGGLRRRLGLNDNDRRYARDAYALSVLAASRERLTLIAGRRTAESDPLSPSRLLFACDRPTIARRTLRYFDGAEAPVERKVPRSLSAGRAQSALPVPRPKPLDKPIESMRVTEFRDYLACPYRYYLGHVLKLGCLDDDAEELGPEAFGSLAHEVLRDFGLDPDANRSTNVDEIRKRLSAALDRAAQKHYGKDRLPAVNVQIEQLRLRLGAFAAWQADWAAQGWRILFSEAPIDQRRASLLVDDVPMYLRARIDRVDVHDASGAIVIFDYKTSDSSRPPDKIHRKQGKWVDLQLPLYRHLAAALQIDREPKLGYIALPKSLADVGHHLAKWTEDDLAEADQAAAEVIRGVRNQEFWPPKSPPPAFSEVFSAICQDAQLGGLLADEEDRP